MKKKDAEDLAESIIEYVDAKVAEEVFMHSGDAMDSCAGMGHFSAREKLKDKFVELFADKE